MGLAATVLRVVVLLLTLAAVGLGAVAASAQAPEARVKALEREIEKKRAEAERLKEAEARLAGEVQALRDEMIAAARTIRDFEREILDLESSLAGLTITETEIQRRLAAGRRQTVQAVMALQRLARFPPEAMIALPMGPSETVRGAILLKAAVPAIERQARHLKRDLADLEGARTEMIEQRRRLAKAVEGLKGDRIRLDAMIQKKAALQRQTRGETRETEERLKAMAAEAKSLQELMRRIEADRVRREQAAKEARAREEAVRKEREAAAERERRRIAKKAPAPKREEKRAEKREEQAAAVGRPITSARGRMPMPVVGRIAIRYGQALPTGLTAKGITIESGNDAQVIAPHDGTVVFAGPFRGYGQLLIIEHGEGYHTLLAGMARIDSEPGAFVQAGEPVGQMGQPAAGKPALYVELRRGGHPINPMPWLAAIKEKVNG